MSENTPDKTGAQIQKVKVSGQPVAVDRIANRAALRLEFNRPAPDGFIPIIDGVVVDPVEDTYQLPGGARGFTATFLNRVQNAAGIQVTEVRHTNVEVDGEEGVEVMVAAIRPRAGELPLLARAICRMSYRDAYTRYLRRGVDDSDKEKARERSFLPRKLETMAANRCIAKLAGIPRAKKQVDLVTEHGPVIFAFRRDQLDMSQADVRTAYINSAAASAARLFGGATEIPDADPVDLGTTEEQIKGADPELDGIDDVEEVANWEVLDDEPDEAQPTPADPESAATEEEPATVGEEEEGDSSDSVDAAAFPAGWPFETDDPVSVAVAGAETKREVWAAIKEVDHPHIAVFLAQWCVETEYDTEEDEDGIYAIWSAKKGKDGHRAACKVLMDHWGME